MFYLLYVDYRRLDGASLAAVGYYQLVLATTPYMDDYRESGVEGPYLGVLPSVIA